MWFIPTGAAHLFNFIKCSSDFMKHKLPFSTSLTNNNWSFGYAWTTICQIQSINPFLRRIQCLLWRLPTIRDNFNVINQLSVLQCFALLTFVLLWDTSKIDTLILWITKKYSQSILIWKVTSLFFNHILKLP